MNPKPPKAAQKRKKIPLELPGWLAEGRSYRWIGEQIGVAHNVVGEWAKDPAIQERVRAIQREVDQQALQALQSLKATAVHSVSSILTGDTCEACGRPKTQDRDRLKAVEIVLDRTGLPKTERQEIAGALSFSYETLSDAELERDILEDAAAILEERQQGEIATAIRAILR